MFAGSADLFGGFVIKVCGLLYVPECAVLVPLLMLTFLSEQMEKRLIDDNCAFKII